MGGPVRIDIDRALPELEEPNRRLRSPERPHHAGLGLFTLVVTLAACTEATLQTGPTPNAEPTVDNPNADETVPLGEVFTHDATQGGTTFSDSDGDALSYTIEYAPDARGLTDSGGVISGTPNRAGTIAVTITADDGNGGSAQDAFDIIVSEVALDDVANVFNGRIDLSALDDYENTDVPNYINVFNDGGNPVTDEGATLGRVLFYDVALSIDNTVSCASCHVQANGFSDRAVVSEGVEGGQTGRHSMRLVNTAYARETRFFWDERAASHEQQESQPLHDHNEHGFSGQAGRPDFDDLVAKIEARTYYQQLFTLAFGDASVTEQRLQLALAQFTKSITSFDSRYDIGRAQTRNDAADFPNFTAEENAGKTLFLDDVQDGGAGCDACHRAPEFDIAPNRDHNGVVGVANDPTSFDFTATRSPTLRDLVAPDGTPNGPFMHDGSLSTLRAVIEHYDQIEVPAGADPNQFRNTIDGRLRNGPNLQSLGLTEAQMDQLEAFLRTLTGSNVYVDEKWSDPFIDP